MKNLPPVIISGSTAVDRIMSFDGHFPDLIQADKLHSISISIFLDKLVDARGGIGANIAYSMALLGDEPVLLSSVGPDAQGYIDDLSAMGIDTSRTHYSKLPTASFNVFTDGANRQIGGFYPGAMGDAKSLSFEPWKDTADALFVIAPHDPAAMDMQVEQCRKHNLRLFYDVGQQVTNTHGEHIKNGIDVAELLIVNDYELSVICNKTGLSEEQIKAKIPVVITTLGSDGSVIEGAKVDKPIKVGLVKPDEIADPTGAGDAYRAGFLHGYIRGWDLQTSAELGATTAAYAIENAGTQNHHFTYDQISSRYKDNFNKSLPGK